MAALFAVCLGVSLYAGVAVDTTAPDDRSLSEPTLEQVDATLVDGGAVDPSEIAAGREAAPTGYDVRIELRADGRTWTAGPESPPTADRAERPVSVRVEPGTVRPGTIAVEVWND